MVKIELISLNKKIKQYVLIQNKELLSHEWYKDTIKIMYKWKGQKKNERIDTWRSKNLCTGAFLWIPSRMLSKEYA